jgi:hypothetical protein
MNFTKLCQFMKDIMVPIDFAFQLYTTKSATRDVHFWREIFIILHENPQDIASDWRIQISEKSFRRKIWTVSTGEWHHWREETIESIHLLVIITSFSNDNLQKDTAVFKKKIHQMQPIPTHLGLVQPHFHIQFEYSEARPKAGRKIYTFTWEISTL